MPFATLFLNTNLTNEKENEIISESLKILSEVIGKPIMYCSTQVIKSIGGFGGNCCPSAFIEIKSIGGLNNKQEGLSERYCSLISSKTDIKSEHIYLTFTEMKRNNWGYDKTTF